MRIKPFSPACAVLLATAFAVHVPAAELAYRWKVDQRFSYRAKIVVDSDLETTTYQGVIHYTVNQVQPEQSTVTYRGGLREVKKSKTTNRGGFGPFGSRGFRPTSFPDPFSSMTFRGKIQTTSVMTITPNGSVLALDGDSQLPFLLGNVSLLPFESLPKHEARAWVDDGGIAISEKKDNSPFGRFGPMHPFGRNESPKNVRAAGERASYELQSIENQRAVIQKVYQLDSPDIDGKPSFTMTGKGVWEFDLEENVPAKMDMDLVLGIRSQNTSTKVPITIEYQLLSEQELADFEEAERQKALQAKEAAEKRKIKAATPLTAQETREAIVTLNSGNEHQIRTKLMELNNKSLDDPDKAIADAIEPHVKSSDSSIKRLADLALKKWSPSYAANAKLRKAYEGPSPVDPTGLQVQASTPLFVGQVVQARRSSSGSFWYPARVKELLRDGGIRVAFLTWGKEQGSRTETLTRYQIQLAPPELPQPELPRSGRTMRPKPSSPSTRPKVSPIVSVTDEGSELRTWSDKTGRFNIEASFEQLEDGIVTLKTSKGKTAAVPLSKLSEADQKYVDEMEENPFKIVD